MISSVNSIDIVTLSRNDYQECSEFLAFIYNRTEKFWLDRFNFIWDQNPAFSETHERGFVLKDQMKIVGFIGKFPTKFLLAGKEGIAWNGTGLAIHPAYRKMGLGKKIRSMHFESCKDSILFATSAANITQKINLALGFKKIPHNIGAKSVAAIFPVNSSYHFILLKEFLFCNYTNITPTLKHVTGIRKLLKFNNDNAASSKNMIKPILTPGVEVDILWAQKKNENAYTNIRTSDVLSWYLVPCEGLKKYLLGIYNNDNSLVGYVLVKKCGFNNFSVLVIADVWIKYKYFTFETIISVLRNIYQYYTDETTASIIYPVYHHNEYELLKANCFSANYRNDSYVDQSGKFELTSNNHYLTFNQGDKLLVKDYNIYQ